METSQLCRNSIILFSALSPSFSEFSSSKAELLEKTTPELTANMKHFEAEDPTATTKSALDVQGKSGKQERKPRLRLPSVGIGNSNDGREPLEMSLKEEMAKQYRHA